MYKLDKKQSTCNNVQSACKDFMSDVVTCKTAPSPIKVLVWGKSSNWLLLVVTVVTICCLFSVMYTILTAFFNGPFAGSMARRRFQRCTTLGEHLLQGAADIHPWPYCSESNTINNYIIFTHLIKEMANINVRWLLNLANTLSINKFNLSTHGIIFAYHNENITRGTRGFQDMLYSMFEESSE